MASTFSMVLHNGVISGTGGLSTVVSIDPDARRFVIVYNVSVAGTTITLQSQHAVDNVAAQFASTGVSTTTLTTTGQTVVSQLLSNAPISVLPFMRLNVTAITGSFTILATLYYEKM